jgi:hypothetical protein
MLGGGDVALRKWLQGEWREKKTQTQTLSASHRRQPASHDTKDGPGPLQSDSEKADV